MLASAALDAFAPESLSSSRAARLPYPPLLLPDTTLAYIFLLLGNGHLGLYNLQKFFV